jgi:hypothetical protein
VKWVFIALGVIAFVVAVVAVAGAMLPVKHRATRRARFEKPAEAIDAVISGPPDWRPDVKAFGAMPDSNGRKFWWEQDSQGQKITYELLEHTPTRYVTRIADEKLPFGGTWTIETLPVSATTSDVRVTEDGEVYNVIFRFVSRFVMGHTATIDAYLQNLGAKLGEKPRIES